MKNLIILVFICVTFASTAAPHYMKVVEHAAEFNESSFGSAPTKNGQIFVRRCDYCKPVRVRFNARTKYSVNNKKITAKQAETLEGQSATLFYYPKENVVSRVMFYTQASGTLSK